MDDFSDIEERTIYQERFQGSRLISGGGPGSSGTIVANSLRLRSSLTTRHRVWRLQTVRSKTRNIDYLNSDESRLLVARDNVFKAPIEERRSAFEKRLTDALSARAAER